LQDCLLVCARERCNCHRVPDLHQQRLQVIGEPKALWIGVHNSHQHILHRHNHTLRSGFDDDGKLSPMLFQDVFPTRPVEVLHFVKNTHVAIDDFLSCVNFFLSYNLPNQVPLDEVLETEPANLGKLSTPRLEIRVHSSCFGGVLAPMRCLIRITEQHDVVHEGCTHCFPPRFGPRWPYLFWKSFLRSLANFVKGPLLLQSPVLEDLHQQVIFRLALTLCHGRNRVTLLDQFQLALLRHLALVGDRVLVDFPWLPVHNRLTTLECTFLGVAIHFLQEGTT